MSFFDFFRSKKSETQRNITRKEPKQRQRLGFRHYQPQLSPHSLSKISSGFNPKSDLTVSSLEQKWKDFYCLLTQEEVSLSQTSKILQEFVEIFNGKYKTWHSEFSASSLYRPNLTSVRRAHSIPILDLASSRHLLHLLLNFTDNFVEKAKKLEDTGKIGGESYTTLTKELADTIHILYFIWIVCRNTQNVDVLQLGDLQHQIHRIIRTCHSLLSSFPNIKPKPKVIDSASFGDHRSSSQDRILLKGEENIEQDESSDHQDSLCLVQVLFGVSLQILHCLLCYEASWRDYFFLSRENQESIECDNAKSYASPRQLSLQNGILDILQSKLKIVFEEAPLRGSSHDIAILILSAIGALVFQSAEAQNQFRNGGLLRSLIGWLRWPCQKTASNSSENQETTISLLQAELEYELQLHCWIIISESIHSSEENLIEFGYLGGWPCLIDFFLWTAESFAIDGGSSSLDQGRGDGARSSEYSLDQGSGTRSYSWYIPVSTNKPLTTFQSEPKIEHTSAANWKTNQPPKRPVPELRILISLLSSICFSQTSSFPHFEILSSPLTRTLTSPSLDSPPPRNLASSPPAAQTPSKGTFKERTLSDKNLRSSKQMKKILSETYKLKIFDKNRLLRLGVRFVLDIFNEEIRQSPNNARVRHKLKTQNGELQLQILSFLSDLTEKYKFCLALCRRFRIWDLLFSPFFFFVPVSDNIFFRSYEVNARQDINQFGRVRSNVLNFVKQIAVVDHHDNIDECRWLLETAQENPTNLHVVLPTIRCLASILKSNKEVTLEVLNRLDVLSILSSIIQQQATHFVSEKSESMSQSAESLSSLPTSSPSLSSSNSPSLRSSLSSLPPSQTLVLPPPTLESATLTSSSSQPSSPLAGSSSPFPFQRQSTSGEDKVPQWLLLQGRQAAVSLVMDCIEGSSRMAIQALEGNQVVDALLPLLFEENMRMEALGPLSYLMRFSPIPSGRNEQAIANITSLYHSFFSLLQQSQSKDSDQGFKMLLDLLDSISRIASHTPLTQKRFKEVGVFLHFINLLNAEKNPERLPVLTAKVLKTLVSLLARNSKNKRSLKFLGYDGLKNLVLRALQVDTKRILKGQIIHLILSLVVDGQMDWEGRYQYIIQSPDVISFMFGLLPHLETEMQHELLDAFIPFVAHSTLNRSLCCQQSAVFMLLEMLGKQQDQIELVSKMINVVEVLGAHSTTVPELKMLFQLLQEDVNGLRPRMQLLLLRSLQYMCSARSDTPEVFFTFDGISAGLALPPLSIFPTTTGFSFCTWLRVESFTDPLNSPRFQPLIFSFSAADVSLDVYFKREIVGKKTIASFTHYMVIQIQMGGRSTREIMNQFEFDQKEWYCICLMLTNNTRVPWKDNDARLYVNGKLVQKLQIPKYPSFPEGIPVQGHIGTRPQNGDSMADVQHTPSPFFGQMATIYFFDDALTPAQVKGFYELGPFYSSCFQSVDLHASIPKSAQPLFDGSLTGRILLCYNCKASEGKFYLDSVLERERGKDLGLSYDAKGLGHLNACVTRDVKSQIRCLGGIKVFLPLFAQVDQPLIPIGSEAVSYQSDTDFMYHIFSCLQEMLRDSDTNQHEFWRCHGFAILGFLLRSVSFRHVGLSLLDFVLPRFAIIIRHAESRKEFFRSFFFDFRVWLYMEASIQLSALRVIRKWVMARDDSFTLPLTVQNLLDILRQFYFYTFTPPHPSAPSDLFGFDPWIHPHNSSIVLSRPSMEDLKSIRRILFDILHKMIKAQGFSFKNTKTLVRSILDCTDILQLEELLEFICWHLYAPLPELAGNLILLGGPLVFLPLLQIESESVRVLVLEIIAKLQWVSKLQHEQDKLAPNLFSGSSTKPKRLGDSDVFVAVGSFLSTFPFREKTQKILTMILVNKLRDRGNGDTGSFLEMSEDILIQVPEVLPLLLKLLHSSDVVLRQLTLQQVYLLLSNNKHNRAVMDLWLGWQDSLFGLLADPELRNECEEGSVRPVNVIQDIILNIFKLMLLYSFQEKKSGWKVMERTLAFLHPYAMRGVIDPISITRRLFEDLVRGIRAESMAVPFLKGDGDLVRSKSSRIDMGVFLLPNILRFLFMVEQFVFYVGMVADHRSSLSSSMPFKVIQGAHVKGGVWEDLELVVNLLDILHNMDLLGTSPILAEAASRSKVSVAEVNRVALRFSLFACSEGGMVICAKLVPRIRVILQFFVTKKNTVHPLIPYVLGNLLKIWREIWLKDKETSGKEESYQEGKTRRRPSEQGEIKKRIHKNGVEPERRRVEHTRSEPILDDIRLQHRQLTKDPTNGEYVSDIVIPVIHELMVMCLGSLKKRNAEFVTEFERLSSQSRIREFLLSLLHNFGDHRWDFLHDFLESVSMEIRREENDMCEVIEKERADWLDQTDVAMEEQSAADATAERRMLQEAKALKDEMNTKEWRRRWKVRNSRVENDRRIAWQWRKLLRELTDERASSSRHKLSADEDHWKLDKTENFSRMRLKLRRNWNFDSHAGAAHEIARGIQLDDSEPLPPPPPPPPPPVDPILQMKGLKLSDILDMTKPNGEEAKTEEEVRMGRKSVNSDGPSEEKMVYSTGCHLITPMKATPGRLEISTTHIYFWETLELRPKDELHRAPKDRKWRLEQIREIHMRRYLLRRSALEIFLVDQTNAFFNFDQRERSKVFSKIIDLRPPNLVYSETGTPEEILKKSGLTKRWQQGQISNFDYLMQINTIAGRTYNDLSQYPVFPWIISNFTSEELDLNDPGNYRDLSKPIGALNEGRKKDFVMRYQSFTDMDVPPFHYGSHYSNSGVVLYYLLRVEPFTSLFIKLQGGKFDIADRLFDGFESTWKNCMTNPSDVKELIPEFFYFPEFLLNLNGFYFGKMKGGTGRPLGDVVLPKWAKSAQDCINIHRDALEGPIVSASLHQWIDLIFGFKQQGKEAVEAVNVFYYLTYEGAVNLDAITDDNVRKATESQIDHFGQTPSQLLKKPHPPRDIQAVSSVDHLFSEKLRRSLRARFLELGKSGVVFIGVPETHVPSNLSVHLGLTERIITVDRQRVAACHRWVAAPPDAHPPFVFEIDPLLHQRRRIGIPFAPELPVLSSLFSVTDDGRTIISCGHWDNSFKLTVIDGAKQTQSVSWHKDIITCLSLGKDGRTLATGSKDTTLAIWQLQMRGNVHRVVERPSMILHGHNDEVTCVCINVELDVAVSGAKDGRCIIHSLRKGTFVRSMQPTNHALNLVSVAGDKIVTYTSFDLTVRLYSLNGELLSSFDTKERLNRLLVTREGRYFVMGGQQGTVSCRDARTLELVYRLPTESPVGTIELTNEEQHMLVGLENGKLLIISSEL